MVAGALLAACGGEPAEERPERPDPVFEMSVEALDEVAWTGFVARVDDRVPEWDEEEEAWVFVRDRTELDFDYEVVSESGEVLALEPTLDDMSPRWEAPRELEPGVWTVRGLDGDEVLAEATVEITDHGQLTGGTFDPTGLDARIYRVEGIEVLSFEGILGKLADPMILSLTAVDEGPAGAYDLDVYVPGEDQEGLCRVWSGQSEVGPDGRLVVDAPDLVVGAGEPLVFQSPYLQLGFDASGEEIRGLAVDARIDTRDMDALFSAPDASEPTLGSARDVLQRFGALTHVCPGDESDEDWCARFRLYGGEGSRTTEAEVVQRVGDVDSLDEVPPCGGVDEGELHREWDVSCSTVGSLAMGSWFVGLGVLLFRRRRTAGSDPAA